MNDLKELFNLLEIGNNIKVVDKIYHNEEHEQIVFEIKDKGQISLFYDNTYGFYPYKEREEN